MLTKKQTDLIYCVPATLRKCDGIIIETLTVQPQRKIIFEALEWFKENDFYVYSIRHKENDMSYPYEVCKNPILVNRFGWFITKNKMKFHETGHNTSVRLNVKNMHFYGNNDSERNGNIELVEYYYDYAIDILLTKFMDYSSKLTKDMVKAKNIELIERIGK